MILGASLISHPSALFTFPLGIYSYIFYLINIIGSIMPTILSLEMFMIKKTAFVVVIILSLLVLSSCNLPRRQSSQSQIPTSTSLILPEASPTPVYLCDNQFFPSKLGDTWEFSGSNTAIGAYSRTDSITTSSAEVFSVSTTLSNITYAVNYGCSPAGLSAANPIQQYGGALLSGPNAPVNVKLTSTSGISLPAKIAPGDTWQQTADFEASSKQLNMNGRFVFDYAAVGYENVTVPYGTFNALRVDATIRVEVSPLRVLAGTYSMTTWMVPDIGVVKSEGTSHIPGVDFTDAIQLTNFAKTP
jgi:hypothetical protein